VATFETVDVTESRRPRGADILGRVGTSEVSASGVPFAHDGAGVNIIGTGHFFLNSTTGGTDDEPLPKMAAVGIFRWLLPGSVARGAAGMLILRVLQVGLEFLCGLVLARLLGASSYGAYAFAVSWVGLLGIPAACGFDRFLIREVAKFQARAQWQLLRGMLRRSGQIVLVASTVLALAAAVSARLLATEPGSEMAIALQLGMIIVPLVAISRLRQAALQGLGRVVWGQTPETLVQPLVLLCCLGAMYLLQGVPRTGPTAVILHTAAAAVACAGGIAFLHRSLPARAKTAPAAYQTRAWFTGAMPFLWILGMNVIVTYTDVIMLGLLVGSEPTGVYRVASQMAAFVALPLTAISLAFAPTIASLYVLNDMASLQRKATRSAQAIVALALPIMATMFFFGRHILALFGPEFTAGYPALVILSCAYVLNAAMGTSGYLLIMTRHERAVAITFSATAAIDVIANLLLIPVWGINGAAASTALSVVLVSVVFAVLAYRMLAIQPTALVFRRRLTLAAS
jgi:O-antigen/teichoic acid export membrane protein